ncbi:unnamed protein product [Penicillium salamii]|uniref:Store-operated calcium entry-associated regulatory factor n=1 Tax=Penicillium salamii TaxID=1612424 RepID=A0A9W4NKF7_9EURO|nr:unnamed protein product [Penicillium salamii]
MRLLLALACLIAPTICAKPGNDAIRLSNVQTLTLHANRLTSARRVSPIPQLNCIGPNKKVCNLYQPDVMRCTNQGHDYDLEDVQWTCTADLPPEFKLGATDVICEGYRHADDKWVLKGSCGVEYRMLLTELGEERFGYTRWDTPDWDKMSKTQKFWTGLGNLIFFGFLLAVFLMIAVPFVLFLAGCLGLRRSRGDGAGRGWGGGGGGPGGGGPPPPPYSAFDSYKSTDDQRWRPGFWSGAAGGAAAGYGLGRYSNGERRTAPRRSGGYDAGEGSSRTPSFSSTTASTGFGSTRRR